jgi:glycosyltransferase involved in cell wall biosynthesis
MEGDKIKVLWISDAVAATGFGRVAHSVLDELVKLDKFDLHVLGINYFGDPHGYDYRIYPASAYGNNVYGFGRIPQLLEYLKPDVVFIFNDIWVIAEYLNVIPQGIPIVTYSPIDAGPIKQDWLKTFFERVTVMCVYTDYAHKIIQETYPLLNPVVIPHGIDMQMFYPKDMSEARATLNNMQGNEWIVLNANRNQPRKRIDSTMRAFAEFAKDKPPTVKLYLHMALVDVGWDIQNMWKRLGIEDRIVITNPTLAPQNPVTNAVLNNIYNSCNVGLNTSMGEGWGLPSFEHAATRHVQIVPDSSACQEIFGDGRGLLADVLEQPYTYTGGINTDGFQVSEKSVTEKLQYAYDHPKECEEMVEKMYEYICLPKFRWSNIAKTFSKYFIIAAKTKKHDSDISEQHTTGNR